MKTTTVICLMCGITTIYPIIEHPQDDRTVLAISGETCFPKCCVSGKIKEED